MTKRREHEPDDDDQRRYGEAEADDEQERNDHHRQSTAEAWGVGSVAVGGNVGGDVTVSVTQEFSGRSVPLEAAVPDPSDIFLAVGVEHFTGRQWLLKKIDQFILSNPCGYIFIEADAGLGKTALAAWLVKSRNYINHFADYSDGALTRTALTNLAGQLIAAFNVHNMASVGIVPEWAQDPARFGSLLSDASKNRQTKDPIVLVVDGLDGAEARERGLPFGLPAVLPEGVYVVATHRPGLSLERPKTPKVTLRIVKNDQDNASDISEYLAKMTSEDALATVLTEAGVHPANFSELLAERCGGVWIYLSYVLREVRSKLRRPDEISDLPLDLQDYYVAQVRHWQMNPGWNEGLKALLATLGVAGEPLTAESLTRLAGVANLDSVQEWCDLTIRPFLTATPSSTADELQYQIYHASFRDVLNPDKDHVNSRRSSQSSYEQAVASEMRKAAAVANNRIADIYMTYFGGLQNGLPALAQDPAIAEIDGGYPLRNLAFHLVRAGRVSDLHLLLAAEHVTGDGHVINVWLTAHDHADAILSYLTDVELAKKDIVASTDRTLTRRGSATTLGLEIRYALIASSLNSVTAGIPAALLEQLVRLEAWSPRRAYDHAQRLVSPVDQLNAMVAIYNALEPSERPPDLLDQMLRAASAIADERERARQLAALVPCLPSELLERALVVAVGIDEELICAEALSELAPRLPPELVERALDIAETSSEPGRASKLALIIHRG
jgi:hypothetical protein